jgi:hypothetical protein
VHDCCYLSVNIFQKKGRFEILTYYISSPLFSVSGSLAGKTCRAGRIRTCFGRRLIYTALNTQIAVLASFSSGHSRRGLRPRASALPCPVAIRIEAVK